MQSLKDLFEKELKNLYALEKQIQDIKISLQPSVSKKLMKRVERFTTNNGSDYNTIQEMAQDLSINPGSTTDSVAQEMLKNISEIANLSKDANVKNAGLIASLNRLLAYKSVSYDNVKLMAEALDLNKEAKTLKKIKSKNKDLAKKFKKLARKKLFKKALI